MIVADFSIASIVALGTVQVVQKGCGRPRRICCWPWGKCWARACGIHAQAVSCSRPGLQQTETALSKHEMAQIFQSTIGKQMLCILESEILTEAFDGRQQNSILCIKQDVNTKGATIPASSAASLPKIAAQLSSQPDLQLP